MLANLRLLDEHVGKNKLNWSDMAEELGIRREQLYRWYHDTHQKKLNGNIVEADMQIINQMVRLAIKTNQPLDKEY